jgi:hypothetical protein
VSSPRKIDKRDANGACGERRGRPARHPGVLRQVVPGVSFARAIRLLQSGLTILLLSGTVSLVVQQMLPSPDLNFRRGGNVT